MAATLDELTLAAEGLNPEDRDELLSRLGQRRQVERASARRVARRTNLPRHALFWETVQEAVRPTEIAPVYAAVEITGFDAFVAEVQDFVTQGCAANMPLVQRNAVIRVVIECLVEDMVGRMPRAIPIAAKSLIDNRDRIAIAVEQSFPGYYRAGLLDRVAMMAA